MNNPKSLFNEAFVQYGPMVTFWAKKIIGDRQVAKDLTNDVFMKLWENIGLVPKKQIPRWLRAELLKACKKYFEAEAIHSLSFEQYYQAHLHDVEQNRVVSDEEILLEAQILNQLMESADGLEGKQRTAFFLEMSGWNTKEIAQDLNIKEQTARNYRAIVIQRLRSKVLGSKK
jgi:RNA polymerase sigma factor (sigma-70 family)